jgi:rhodanese-related sulfurtransferase
MRDRLVSPAGPFTVDASAVVVTGASLRPSHACLIARSFLGTAPVNFLLANWYLFAIALVSGGMLLWPLVNRRGGSGAVTALEAVQLINHRNAIVVDVRDAEAFAAGSLTGARNMPAAALESRIAEIARFKARPAIIVCESGQQSSRAVATLKAAGFEEAHPLSGGLAAWKQAGLPLVGAARDSARPPSKDRAKNPRNDIRTGERGKTNKGSARTPAPPAAESKPAADALNGRTVIETDATRTDAGNPDAGIAPAPDRVKEVS